MSKPERINHAGIPKTARPISDSIPIEDAAWWWCAQPDDEGAFALSVSAHLLGFDQVRGMWVSLIIGCDSSILSPLTFTAYKQIGHGLVQVVRDEAGALTLWGYRALFNFASKAPPACTEDFKYAPQHRIVLPEDPDFDEHKALNENEP
jgi:hypothetical protein